MNAALDTTKIKTALANVRTAITETIDAEVKGKRYTNLARLSRVEDAVERAEGALTKEKKSRKERKAAKGKS
jgi:hypothetical protein